MTRALTYAELDVPYCKLTYGTAPCNAVRGYATGESGPVAVGFNQDDIYLTRGAGLTGAADSKQLTISFWIRITTQNIVHRIFAGATSVGGAANRFFLQIAPDNFLRVIIENSSDTVIADFGSSHVFFADGRWRHVLISIDLTDTGKRHLYIDDASDLSFVVTYTDDSMDFTIADWAIGADADGTEFLGADIADFWMDFGTYIDFSVEANRRDFRDSDGRPVYLGANGENPTASSPIVFFANPRSTWHENLGTGGDFSVADGDLEDRTFVTGDIKCFNTKGTCQDPVNFNKSTQPGFSEFLSSTVNSTDLTTYTFSSHVLGDEPHLFQTRHIVLPIVGYATNAARSISSVTINGESASVEVEVQSIGGSTSVLSAIAVAEVDDDLSGDIVVTFDGAMTACAIGPYRVVNLSSTTPTDTDIDTDGDADDEIELSVDILANSLVVAVAGNRAAGSSSWFGLGEDFDDVVESGGNASAASLTFEKSRSSYAVTNVPGSAGDEYAGVVAVFQLASADEGPEVTHRFAVPTSYLPSDIDCIPSLIEVNTTPARISLGEDLGQRASVDISFRDHRWPDRGNGFDKYVDERPYDPETQGTFFGRFRARQPFLRGQSLRVIRGLLGQTLGAMETRHYIVESFTGPNLDGVYKITAKDAVKMTDGDRAQAPILSNGFLSSSISSGDTTATLSPAGIGDAEYPSSGYLAIGGTEIVAFNRTGNSLTLTRAQFNTEAQAHDGQDRCQLCLQYVTTDPADIIYDLLVNYADMPSSYIPLATWQTETATYLGNVYTALIAEPVSVKKLITELVQQAALAVWWADTTQQMRLQVLRAVASSAFLFDESNVLDGTLRVTEQPDKRISQVWTYFGKINPLEPDDEPNNYRSTAITVDADAERDNVVPKIKKIFSRWIADGGRSIAERLNEVQLGRYRTPPRKFTLGLPRHNENTVPVLGTGYQLSGQPLQEPTGEAEQVPVQFTRINPESAISEIEAEEILFEDLSAEPGPPTVIIDADTFNANFRTLYDSLFPEPEADDEIFCIVSAGVTVGSTSTTNPAFDVGSWPAGVILTLTVEGRIQGAGGDGGDARSGPGVAQGEGEDGGVALYTREDLTLNDADGEIWGGGGGGGGADPSGLSSVGDDGGGGGGAGSVPGVGGESPDGVPHFGEDGTSEAGGAGGPAGSNGSKGGDGGDPGQDGQTGEGGAGGSESSGGASIDGISFVTTDDGPGDRQGPTVN